VLPVLPALLSAGATGGRRRPLGIALGLAITFTVTIVGLATVIDGVGLGSDAMRWVAVAALAGFGLAIMVPSVAARLEAPLARLSRFGPRGRGDGFASGVVVGGALGFVYAPCAGPILAAVITVGAASSRTVPVALGFALGSAVVLLLLAFGGRAVAGRRRAAGRGPGLQRALGGVLVATAVVMATNLDVRFQSAIASHLPAGVVNPTHALETSDAVAGRLRDLRAPSRFAVAQARARAGAPHRRHLGQSPTWRQALRRWTRPRH
jgi:cytochrome c biogenesis protein CcdA